MAWTYKALALLLTYPGETLQSTAREAVTAVAEEGLVPAKVVRALTKLAEGLADGDLYDLQERYVQLFDRTRSLSLNLYEHVHGESRDRGQAMAALLELYRSRGLELTANELPDHLPVFLEFLSQLPQEEASSLLGEAGHVIEALGERLHRRGSPYRAVFGALAALGRRADSAALAALLAEPEDDPNDLAALDKSWAETAVTFGPSEVGCPKAELAGRARAAGLQPPPARAAASVS
jgi:nitrate reductase delta subunit